MKHFCRNGPLLFCYMMDCPIDTADQPICWERLPMEAHVSCTAPPIYYTLLPFLVQSPVSISYGSVLIRPWANFGPEIPISRQPLIRFSSFDLVHMEDHSLHHLILQNLMKLSWYHQIMRSYISNAMLELKKIGGPPSFGSKDVNNQELWLSFASFSSPLNSSIPITLAIPISLYTSAYTTPIIKSGRQNHVRRYGIRLNRPPVVSLMGT